MYAIWSSYSGNECVAIVYCVLSEESIPNFVAKMLTHAKLFHSRRCAVLNMMQKGNIPLCCSPVSYIIVWHSSIRFSLYVTKNETLFPLLPLEITQGLYLHMFWMPGIEEVAAAAAKECIEGECNRSRKKCMKRI